MCPPVLSALAVVFCFSGLPSIFSVLGLMMLVGTFLRSSLFRTAVSMCFVCMRPIVTPCVICFLMSLLFWLIPGSPLFYAATLIVFDRSLDRAGSAVGDVSRESTLLSAGSTFFTAESSTGDLQGRRTCKYCFFSHLVVTLLGTYAGFSCLTQGKRHLARLSTYLSFPCGFLFALSVFGLECFLAHLGQCSGAVCFLLAAHPAAHPVAHPVTHPAAQPFLTFS